MYKLKLKILLNSVIIIALVVGIGITYYCIKRIFDEDFLTKTNEFIWQYNQKSDYMLKSLEKSAQNVSTNRDIINIIKSGHYDIEANTVLNDVIKLDTKILAISIYSGDFVYASDSVIGSVPGREYIEDKYIPDGFFDSPKENAWVLRKKESYEGYYRRSQYDFVPGVYTCIQKIVDDDGREIGYLLLDVNYEEIFKLYSSNSNFLGRVNLFLHAGDEYIPSKNNEISDIAKTDTQLRSEHWLLSPNASIIVSVSKEGVYSSMKLLMIFIILTAVIFYAAAYAAGKNIINSIIVPMGELKDKISDYNRRKE